MYELHWTEYLKALGPTIIAVFVAYIAYQQWRVNQASLRERLFERRIAVFKQTQTFLSEILRDAKCSDDNLLNFHDTPQIARFLFDKKMSDYLSEVRKRALKLRFYSAKLEALPVGDERSKMVDLEGEELKWLTDQLAVIFERFEPYLNFSKHR